MSTAMTSLTDALAAELVTAMRSRTTVAPLSQRHPELTIEDAYAVSLAFLAQRVELGERVVGKKIGATSKAVQDMLGVHQPDFGFLTNAMQVVGDIETSELIAPRAEAEIAFILKDDLKGPGVTEDDVVAATAHIAPCFEIVDSRIADWRIGIVDTVADNASCGVFILGDARLDPRLLDLPRLHVVVHKNGEYLSQGTGEAVQGNPAAAVAWLANTLGGFGVTLEAGDVILSGSLVPLAPAVAGDRFDMTLNAGGVAVGHCSANFI